MRIEYHPAIERELREIIKYYNECSPGLGHEFLGEFERQILKIAAMPALWMAVENNIRRSLMKRFPYVVYFRVVETDLVRVTVVKHQRRHPKLGLNRRYKVEQGAQLGPPQSLALLRGPVSANVGQQLSIDKVALSL